MSMGGLTRVAWGLFKVALLFVLVALLVIFPTMLVALFVALFSVVVAQLVTLLGMSVLAWVLFYMAFTLHGVALRQEPLLQAVRASISLMRTQFLPTMGLIILVVMIYFGLGAIWRIPPDDNWVEVAAILVHAFVATGLATATALFYLDHAPDPRQAYEEPGLGQASS